MKTLQFVPPPPLLPPPQKKNISYSIEEIVIDLIFLLDISFSVENVDGFSLFPKGYKFEWGFLEVFG